MTLHKLNEASKRACRVTSVIGAVVLACVGYFFIVVFIAEREAAQEEQSRQQEMRQRLKETDEFISKLEATLSSEGLEVSTELQASIEDLRAAMVGYSDPLPYDPTEGHPSQLGSRFFFKIYTRAHKESRPRLAELFREQWPKSLPSANFMVGLTEFGVRDQTRQAQQACVRELSRIYELPGDIDFMPETVEYGILENGLKYLNGQLVMDGDLAFYLEARSTGEIYPRGAILLYYVQPDGSQGSRVPQRPYLGPTPVAPLF